MSEPVLPPSPVETRPRARKRHLALIGALLVVSLVGCTKTVIVYPSVAVPTTPVAATTACVDKSAADAITAELSADLKGSVLDMAQAAKDENRLADLFADYPGISIPLRQAARDYGSADSWSFENTGDLLLSMKMGAKFAKKARAEIDKAGPHFAEVSFCD